MRRLALAITTTALVAGLGSAGFATAPAASGRGVFTTSSARVDNAWFPLKPGTTGIYKGVRDGKRAREIYRVTRRTKVINGVRCRVIDDRLYLNGRLEERTTDWYAQDRAGNVWYLGERTAVLDEHGKVTSREGSWRDGKDGARRGIFMPRRPRVGQSYQQEFYKGHAEDHSQVLSLSARIRTPAVSSRHAMLTKETTPLEPDVIDHKVYVRGIGTVLEKAVKGGQERLELVAIRHG